LLLPVTLLQALLNEYKTRLRAAEDAEDDARRKEQAARSQARVIDGIGVWKRPLLRLDNVLS
jgi:hypothetical protein